MFVVGVFRTRVSSLSSHPLFQLLLISLAIKFVIIPVLSNNHFPRNLQALVSHKLCMLVSFSPLFLFVFWLIRVGQIRTNAIQNICQSFILNTTLFNAQIRLLYEACMLSLFTFECISAQVDHRIYSLEYVLFIFQFSFISKSFKTHNQSIHTNSIFFVFLIKRQYQIRYNEFTYLSWRFDRITAICASAQFNCRIGFIMNWAVTVLLPRLYAKKVN